MSNQIPAPEVSTDDTDSPFAQYSDNLLVGGNDIAWQYNPDYHRMSDLLGVQQQDKMDENIAQKIGFIRDFVQAQDETDARAKIQELVRSLGVQYRGRELVQHLYQYARLSADRRKLDQELSLYQKPKEEPVKKTSPEVRKLKREKNALKRKLHNIIKVLQ